VVSLYFKAAQLRDAETMAYRSLASEHLPDFAGDQLRGLLQSIWGEQTNLADRARERTVVLQRNMPVYGIKSGDIGTVVETYEPDGIEVEFVNGAGKTQALLTLKAEDVRSIAENEILSVRSLEAA